MEDLYASLKREAAKKRSNRTLTAMPLSQLFLCLFVVCRECDVGGSDDAFLILTRAAIIGWTTLAVFPLEIAFDVIEGELERRGVEP